MSDSKLKQSSRRTFMAQAGSVALASAAPMIITSKSARAAGRLVLVSWGGSYRTAVEETLTRPFTKETGIEVILVDTPDLAKVKAQVMTKNVEWDVFDAVGPMAMTGIKQGYWEPIDPSIYDAKDLQWEASKFAVPFYGFTGGICWDTRRFPEGKAPKTFAEFFDTKKFPGRRALKNRASETMEIALLADGVPADKMYPLDANRAFKALDRIKGNVTKWVDQTPQTISLVQNNEVDFSYTYATRAKQAQEAGLPIGFSFEQNLVGLEYLTVLKNSPNKANAMKFIAFAMRPDRQAALMNLHGNTPASRKAMSMIKPDIKKWMSNPDNKNNVVCNDLWWADHYDDLTRRFKEWALA